MSSQQEYTASAAFTPPGSFWERVVMFMLMDRLALVWNLATNEEFAEKTFKAYSATMRLRCIAALLSTRPDLADPAQPAGGAQ